MVIFWNNEHFKFHYEDIECSVLAKKNPQFTKSKPFKVRGGRVCIDRNSVKQASPKAHLVDRVFYVYITLW